MTTLERLGPEDLRAVVVGYRDVLRTHQDAINRLNVYPVPDGDTGTNMALTLESVVDELDGADGHARRLQGHQPRVADGSPGQLRRHPVARSCAGVAEGFEAAPEGGDAGVLAESLAGASAAAYEAVMRPVEGTILTVAAGRRRCRGRRRRALIDVLDRARAAAADALERTPDLLPALQAGRGGRRRRGGLPAAARRFPARGRRAAPCPSRSPTVRGRSPAPVPDPAGAGVGASAR